MVLVCLILCPVLSQAQLKYDRDQRHLNFSTDYLIAIDRPEGSLNIYHGASFSVAYSVFNRYRVRTDPNTLLNKIIDRDLYIQGGIATYRRKDVHQALMIYAGPNFRLTLPAGAFFDFGGGFAYHRTFLAGDQFSFNGDVETKRGLGTDQVGILALSGFGWNFFKSNDYPVYLKVSGGMLTTFPHNDRWIIQGVVQAGIGFVLSRIEETYAE